jgi:hypothetical protein
MCENSLVEEHANGSTLLGPLLCDCAVRVQLQFPV